MVKCWGEMYACESPYKDRETRRVCVFSVCVTADGHIYIISNHLNSRCLNTAP